MLTAKREAFCRAMLTARSAAEAYRLAYDASKTTDQNVWNEASKLLAVPEVASRLAELRNEAARIITIKPAQILEELADLAFGTLDDVAPWDEDGPRLIPSADLPLSKRRLVASIKVKRERRVVGRGQDQEQWEVESLEIKPWDKLRALELLGKTLAMFVDKVQVDMPQLQEEVREMAKQMGIDLDGNEGKRAVEHVAEMLRGK